MPSTYRQFCPVARACEIVAERWTPLILRELFCGSTRFNELRRGLPAVWMGQRTFSSALHDRSLVLDGPRELCRRFPSWFHRSLFAAQRKAS